MPEQQDFAKEIRHPKIGQVIVYLDTNDDDETAIKFLFSPPGLGVSSCTLTLGPSDDETWAGAEQLLQSDKLEELAIDFLNTTFVNTFPSLLATA